MTKKASTYLHSKEVLFRTRKVQGRPNFFRLCYIRRTSKTNKAQFSPDRAEEWPMEGKVCHVCRAEHTLKKDVSSHITKTHSRLLIYKKSSNPEKCMHLI